MIWEHAMYKKLVKRLLDIVLSLTGLIVSAIPMAVITLVIKREDPGPAVFKQKRFGIHKSFFTLYKFRSMKLSTPHDVPTHQLEDPEQYLLKSGKFIRKYSLDELPQLLNIFKGDYAQKLSFLFDCRCFFGTFLKVLRHEGVVEGGTGELAKTGKEK